MFLHIQRYSFISQSYVLVYRANRLRFKLPEYDTASNYKRLQERISTPVMTLGKNISPAWKWFSIAASF
ncbi:hypothetical protein D0T87_17005 [Bacteroides sp. 51]|nr:hypothetical protein [Bacteroides sp. 51]